MLGAPGALGVLAVPLCAGAFAIRDGVFPRLTTPQARALCCGVIAPAGLPRPILDRLNRAVNMSINDPAVKERLIQLGSEGGGGTPEEYAEIIRKDSAKWAEAIRRSGAKID